MLIPTQQTYDELQQAYVFLNTELFGSVLPPCLITLQRKRHTAGYFVSKRFVNRSGEFSDEIAINPAYFATTPIKETLSTIAHEMVHLWQHHFGNAGRGRYHNKEWAEKMISIGLHPSDTGEPGGRVTGDLMSDYIIGGGRFDSVCDKLLSQDYIISWLDRLTNTDKSRLETDQINELVELGVKIDLDDSPPKSNRVKYSHICLNKKAVNVWGKPGLNLSCLDCGSIFMALD